jgi:hypothetical protein
MLFNLYCKLGFQHIADLQAYDHILFLVALCAIYTIKDWRRILILVSAFTVGHSLTLALAALNVILPNTALVEFLIPVTIFFTSIFNIFQQNENTKLYIRINYVFALLFGLVHGLGFSTYLRSLLSQEEAIWPPLLAFNVGIELGQLLIVASILLVSIILFRFITQRTWLVLASVSTAIISFGMLLERWPF